jgi:hypothetical protein
VSAAPSDQEEHEEPKSNQRRAEQKPQAAFLELDREIDSRLLQEPPLSPRAAFLFPGCSSLLLCQLLSITLRFVECIMSSQSDAVDDELRPVTRCKTALDELLELRFAEVADRNSERV